MAEHPISVGLPDRDAYCSVHMRLSIALWHSQAFEAVLACYVTLVLKLPPSRAEAEVRKTLFKMQSKTLGGLISELRKVNPANLVSSFEERLKQFLADRNWLVHSSWREHHGDLFGQNRALTLIRRLDGIAEQALQLQKHFGQLIDQWTRAQGTNPQLIEAEFRRILAAHGVIRD